MTETKPKILVVARGQNASAPLAELNNRVAFYLSEAVAVVDGHQPYLIEVGVRQSHDQMIVALCIRLFISRDYLVAVSFENLAQKRKTRNAPVVLVERNGRLTRF